MNHARECMTMMLIPSCCPRCNTPIDPATSIQEPEGPAPGDVTICLECTAILKFAEDLGLIAMLDAEKAALPAEVRDQLTRVQAVVGHLNAKRWRARFSQQKLFDAFNI